MEVHDFSREVQKFSVPGEVQNDLRGGAHLPTPPLNIQPWSDPSTVAMLRARWSDGEQKDWD
jgi:hypothetical protein